MCRGTLLGRLVLKKGINRDRSALLVGTVPELEGEAHRAD